MEIQLLVVIFANEKKVGFQPILCGLEPRSVGSYSINSNINKGKLMDSNSKIAVIGLGYVGLPLARLFATKYTVVGFDINQKRIGELRLGIDSTFEVATDTLKSVLVSTAVMSSGVGKQNKCGLYCTNELKDIADSNYYIITVPTPVDKNNRPDLTPLYKASETVAKVLKKGDIVIYESTVYPGVTEDECVPVLERISGLQFNVDFFAGYSPERINPGDKEHTVDKILKVTAGSTPEIGQKVNALYQSVITAGTHLAPSIKVAEAAKVIENSQRDINIAFVNELAKIFNLMDIDTQSVLEAAGTKWNFLPFKPGLVGGHCIGVDPYYLAQKAQELGYHPEIILAGRRLNDSMGEYVAAQIVKLMIKKGISVNGAQLLMLGITFKENCPDVRNTKIVDVIKALQEYGISVATFDPLANPEEVQREYGLICHPELSLSRASRGVEGEKFDAIVLGVAHTPFLTMDLSKLQNANSVIYDVKGVLGKNTDGRL